MKKKILGEGRRWEGGLERGWFMENAICGRGAAAPWSINILILALLWRIKMKLG